MASTKRCLANMSSLNKGKGEREIDYLTWLIQVCSALCLLHEIIGFSNACMHASSENYVDYLLNYGLGYSMTLLTFNAQNSFLVEGVFWCAFSCRFGSALLNCDITYSYFFITDFDGDDMIGVSDLREVIERLCGSELKLSDSELQILVQNVLEEADLDDDGALSFAEFEHIIDKSSDFCQ